MTVPGIPNARRLHPAEEVDARGQVGVSLDLPKGEQSPLTFQHGRSKIVLPWVLVAALSAALTAWAAKPAPPTAQDASDALAVAREVKIEIEKLRSDKAITDVAVNQRLANIETSMSYSKIALDQIRDSLRDIRQPAH